MLNLTKVSISVTDRKDEYGVHPLFDHKTSEVIGELRHGKITYFDKSRWTESCQSNGPTPITDSLMNGTDFPSPQTSMGNRPNRLTRQKSLTELFGGPF